GCLEKFKNEPRAYSIKKKYDLIIIGAGPAGLTAGVYASILKIDTLLLSTDIGGQAVDSTKIKNYMGFDFITGPELLAKFKNQLIHHHYIDHKIETAVSVRKLKNYFSTKTLSGHIYQSRALIVATGMIRKKLGVPGESKFRRKGICYAASQDIPLLAGKKVAVIGGGNSALQIVLELHKYKCEIIIISIEPWTADKSLIEEMKTIKKLKIFDHHAVTKIKGKEKVEQILIKDLLNQDELEIDIEAIFLAIGLSPNAYLVKHLVELNERGEIEIRPDCSTKTPGLFAAGDVTNVFAKRIVIAAGEGAKAALAARKYLMRE
ncbi:MAG: NAD(P)/FAD-dependent oxidoreductase, partial [Candidatus Aminicenantales bacterium]